ncbi:MAG TPA: membrane protein insertion efficiency factor YidD [Pseudonocardia sp.]
MSRRSPLAVPFIALIGLYRRWVSPALPPRCRFYPSCSAYAAEALEVHGLLKGSALGVWRLLRCAPWHPGGVDPVPPRRRRGGCHARATEERAPC